MDIRRSARTVALGVAMTMAMMGAVALAERVRGIPPWLLMGDAAAVTDRPFYLGTVTLLRTGLVAAAAGTSLAAAWVLRAGTIGLSSSSPRSGRSNARWSSTTSSRCTRSCWARSSTCHSC
jgi:hypothetical protein